MVRAKRPAIFPLRIANAIPFANGYPTMTADRLPGPGVGLLKPWDHERRFRLEQCLLPQFHCVLGEIRRRRVGGSRLLVPEDFRGASNRQTETGRKKSPHHKRRNLLSDSPLLGKANLPKTVM